jgi:hypothetical protein
MQTYYRYKLERKGKTNQQGKQKGFNKQIFNAYNHIIIKLPLYVFIKIWL